MDRSRASRCLAMGGVFLFLLAQSVAAKTISDREGDGFSLDLAEVRAAHHERGEKEWWVFRFRMHSSFGNARLEKVGSREHCPIALRIDLDGDSDSERKVCVYAIRQEDRYELKAPITEGRNKWDESPHLIGNARVWRADGRTIKINFGERRLRPPRKGDVKRIWWAARAVSQNEQGDTSFDYAPGKNILVRQRS